jgi:sulfate permease, SulP family
VLDCEGINFIDSQGSAKLAEIARLANESNIAVRLARLKPIVAGTLERDGVLERIGIDHVHGNVYRAVQAQNPGLSDRPEQKSG